jgi:semaphorin 6
VINTESYDSVSKVSPVIIEEIQVFDTEAPVTNLLVIQPAAGEDSEANGPRLLVVSNEEVQTIPLRRCYSNKITTCRFVFKIKTKFNIPSFLFKKLGDIVLIHRSITF